MFDFKTARNDKSDERFLTDSDQEQLAMVSVRERVDILSELLLTGENHSYEDIAEKVYGDENLSRQVSLVLRAYGFGRERKNIKYGMYENNHGTYIVQEEDLEKFVRANMNGTGESRIGPKHNKLMQFIDDLEKEKSRPNYSMERSDVEEDPNPDDSLSSSLGIDFDKGKERFKAFGEEAKKRRERYERPKKHKPSAIGENEREERTEREMARKEGERQLTKEQILAYFLLVLIPAIRFYYGLRNEQLELFYKIGFAVLFAVVFDILLVSWIRSRKGADLGILLVWFIIYELGQPLAELGVVRVVVGIIGIAVSILILKEETDKKQLTLTRFIGCLAILLVVIIAMEFTYMTFEWILFSKLYRGFLAIVVVIILRSATADKKDKKGNEQQ